MILVTGASGLVGRALLRRLTEDGSQPVRCLVRDPRRLGPDRVRVQIALGDLADRRSFRHALRGVDTVVHLAAAIRDEPGAAIEEVNGLATLTLVRAAERAGVRRFLFASALGASEFSPNRFFRSKALAERAVRESGLESVVVAPSMVYAPGDHWLTLLQRLSLLPLMPVPGRGRARYQPLWAEDAAECLFRALATAEPGARLELAGPDELSLNQVTRTVLRALDRRRLLLHLPLPAVRAALGLAGRLAGPAAFATWEEAQLLQVSMTTPRGTADAEALGVRPKPMPWVLGLD